MFFLLLSLIIIAAALLALFLKPVAISFLLDTCEMDMCATAGWLRFIGVEARIIDYHLHMTVFLFGKKIRSGLMKPGNKNRSGAALFESMHLSDTTAKISYGFHEPHLTGIFSAAAGFAAALVRTADIELEPDFSPENEFLRIEATSELNAGKTLINMLRHKTARRRKIMDQLNLSENVDTLFRSLEDFTQKEGIIGKPVTQGDKTFLPVVSITMGYGSGNANMKGQASASGTSGSTGSSTGTGALGLGAKLCTDAVIVIDGQNVSLLPMNAAGAATGLMDKIPQIISGMKGQGPNQNQSQGQNQSQNQNQQTPAFSK